MILAHLPHKSAPKKGGRKKTYFWLLQISKVSLLYSFLKNCKLKIFFGEISPEKKERKKKKKKRAVVAVGDIARDFPSNFLVLNYV